MEGSRKFHGTVIGKKLRAEEASLQAYWQMREALVWEKPWGGHTKVPG